MKYLLFVSFVAIFATTCALLAGPLDAIPYCLPVTTGTMYDKSGNSYPTSWSYSEGIAFAIFRNGENLGMNHYEWNGAYNYFYGNESYYDVGIGTLWDFGSDQILTATGIGLMDGTYDSVDGAMSITFDKEAYGMVNLTTMCVGETGFSAEIQIPNGLQLTRTFYVPKGPVESWARVVDLVFNPTAAEITSDIGYSNYLGSYLGTTFIEITDHYSVSADDPVSPDDNVVALHWSGKDTIYEGAVMWHSAPTEGSHFVAPYFSDVTLSPGQTKTFMFVLLQGNQSISYTSQMAAELDANPLKLYYGMSSEQISTLQNFNACSAAVPVFSSDDVTLTPPSVCPAEGELVEMAIDYNGDWATLFPAIFEVVILDANNEQQEVLTAASTQVSLPAGSYTARVQLGEECVLATLPFTACYTAPVSSPVAAAPGSGPSKAPTAATSSASVVAASLSMAAIALAL